LSAFWAARALVQAGKPATLWANHRKSRVAGPATANACAAGLNHRRDWKAAEKAKECVAPAAATVLGFSRDSGACEVKKAVLR
jgi:hypothetical protein